MHDIYDSYQMYTSTNVGPSEFKSSSGNNFKRGNGNYVSTLGLPETLAIVRNVAPRSEPAHSFAFLS